MRQDYLYDKYRENKLAFARTLRKNMTEAEQWLWEALRKKRLAGTKFRRQVPLGAFIADFLSYGVRLVIEVDGPVHDRQIDYDRERDLCWQDMGFDVLRFTNDQVLKDLPIVLETIERAVAQKKILTSEEPHPGPPRPPL